MKKCCRTCHWLHNGKCVNEDNFEIRPSNMTMIQALSEDGVIDENLRETFYSKIMKDLTEIIDGLKISKKAKAEVLTEIEEGYITNWVEEIDSNLYNLKNDVEVDEPFIKDPDEFVCSNWF